LPKPVEATRLLAMLSSIQPAAKANSTTASERSKISPEKVLRERILKAFDNDTRTLLDQMQSSIDKEDLTSLRDTMHALRGCALAVGATEMANDVRAIEHAVDDDILELAQDAMPRLNRHRDGILLGLVETEQ
jgi:HPt (histidine-containing phosphotransfer) domain-containing protein